MSFRLFTAAGNLTFVTSVENDEPDEVGMTWLRTTLVADLRIVAPLQLTGQLSLTTDDVSALVTILERFARPRFASAGRVSTWQTYEEDVELVFAWHGEHGHLSGRVDVSGGSASASLELADVPMTLDDFQRSLAEVRAAYEQPLARSESPDDA